MTPYATPLPQEIGQNRSKFLIAREYMGIVSYGVLGRFFPRPVAMSPIAPQPDSVSLPAPPQRS